MDLVSLATIPRDSALARRRQQFYTFMGGMVLSDPLGDKPRYRGKDQRLLGKGDLL